MKTFRPKKLKKLKSGFAMGTFSMVFWDYACELEKRAKSIPKNKMGQKSNDVLGAIIFFTSSFEAYLNEQLALILSYEHPKEMINFIKAIKDAPNANFSIKDKVLESVKLIDRTGKGDIDKNTLANYVALYRLRNTILHFDPNFSDLYDFPQSLQDALNRSKVDVDELDCTETFRKIEVLDWAKDTVKKIITEFILLRKGNPKDFFNE